ARIDHENVCKVYEVGEIEGRSYISMQFIDGKPLSELASSLTLEQKVKVMKDVCEAAHAAHRLSLIHRDIKPANILVEFREGIFHPYIVDFGLVREQMAPGLTTTGAVMGTPAYMSPEQVSGRIHGMDRRSDVFSLGVTLYEVLSGKLPYPGNDTAHSLIE